jgi:hypothetical protein
MKKFFLMATMLFMFGAAKAQIADVQQKGNLLLVYGENNKKLSVLSISSSEEYLGMGSSFYIVKKGSLILSYDQDSKKIGVMTLSSSEKFKNAGGNSFNIQNGSLIITYDKNCKKLSVRSL